jgi:hypothetical protein
MSEGYARARAEDSIALHYITEQNKQLRTDYIYNINSILKVATQFNVRNSHENSSSNWDK